MEEIILGVNVPGGTNLGGLDAALAQIAKDGWQAAELNLDTCPLLLGGYIQQPVVDCVREVFARYPLHYTAHASYGLDLRSGEAAMHRRVLLNSIEVCAMLGIDRFNCHYEAFSHDRRAEAQYRSLILQAADLAGERGVRLNVENVEIDDYRYALDFVSGLGHESCAMTLDLGHLWIAANRFGFDYVQAVRDCAPWVRHVHINDNHGIFEPMRLENKALYDTLGKGTRFTFSRGDIHIPPFWGSAPLARAFQILIQAGYPGIWMCEYYSHLFHPLNSQVRLRVRQELEQAEGRCAHESLQP
ncbi:MAG: sugar phosphate isomerase/epimerase family protein [Eubacteriales bacterium]|nr:sugar phosphate isomerase/epimerase family protein [Eubacteriales bacterium]